ISERGAGLDSRSNADGATGMTRPVDKTIRMPSVPNSPNTCPIDIDEAAEAYIMDRLSPADALHFENHCRTCPQCAAAAEDAERFVRAIKVAAGQARGRPRRTVAPHPPSR